MTKEEDKRPGAQDHRKEADFPTAGSRKVTAYDFFMSGSETLNQEVSVSDKEEEAREGKQKDKCMTFFLPDDF